MKEKILKFLAFPILICIFLYLAYLAVTPIDSGADNIAAQIQSAILKEDIHKVEDLLSKNNININDENIFLDLPLFLAIDTDNVEMFDLLLEYGADVNVQIFSSYSNALELAILKNNTKMIEKIIQAGYNINTKNARLDNAMAYALKFNSSMEVIQTLINLGIELNYIDDYGMNYLHLSSSLGSRDIYDYFFELMPTYENQKTNDNQSMIHFAAESGNLEFFKYILSKNFDVYEKNVFGKSVLHLSRSKDITAYLLEELSFDVNERDYQGIVALMDVFSINDFQKQNSIIKYLVEKGADVNAQSNLGTTPIYMAAFAGDYDAVKFLIENGANVNICDASNSTPLHAAAFSGNTVENPMIVKLLLDSGADKTIKDDNGRIPLELAINVNNIEIINLLK
jgi:ankyrin repeat protein